MAEPQPHCTPAEYLALERAATTKSEYLDGRVVAMAGASRKHNLVTGNVLAALHPQLRGRDCEIYPSDMRVRIGDKPILEIIVNQLAYYDFRDITLVTNHKDGQIKSYFRDGHRFGVRITYLRERVPLGTVGAIGLIKDLQGDFLLMNCDILTDLDFGVMMDRHKSSDNTATVLAVKHEEQSPYGVLSIKDGIVTPLTPGR